MDFVVKALDEQTCTLRRATAEKFVCHGGLSQRLRSSVAFVEPFAILPLMAVAAVVLCCTGNYLWAAGCCACCCWMQHQNQMPDVPSAPARYYPGYAPSPYYM